jgi:ribose-phosphate pyrophosphokinase
MPKEPLISPTGLDARSRIIIANQESRPRQPLILPGHSDLEWESAARLRLLEPLLGTEDMVLLTGRSNPQLARDVARYLNFLPDFQPYEVFQDGESHVKLGENVRGKNVYIIQTTARSADRKLSVNDAIMDAFFMVRAAKKADAEKVRLIIPYFGYSRQDQRNQSRESVSASDVAQMFMDAGAHSLLVMDLHSGPTEGATKNAIDILHGAAVLLPAIGELCLDPERLLIISPDTGGMKRAIRYSQLLGMGKRVSFLPKDRYASNETQVLEHDGSYDGYDVVAVDDMVDTLGSLIEGAEDLKQRGAGRIFAAATHGLFSPNKQGESAEERLLNSVVEKVIVTDTVAHADSVRNHPKVEIVSVAQLIAEAIWRIHMHRSVSSLLPTPPKVEK